MKLMGIIGLWPSKCANKHTHEHALDCLTHTHTNTRAHIHDHTHAEPCKQININGKSK